MRNRQHRRQTAFSLVEITVAIGVIAFALVGLMGLLSASLNTGKASEEDTRYASMSQQMLDLLRTRPFDDIPYVKSVDSLEAAVLPPVYFDSDGGWAGPKQTDWPKVEEPAPASAVYKCSAIVEVDSDTISPPIPKQPNQPPEQRINLLRVHLAFTPINRTVVSMDDVTAKDPIIHATIPRY